MESFENPVSKKEEGVLNDLEDKTIDAIRSGDATPLPEFLRESPVAREAYKEALQSAESLKESMRALPAEEKAHLIEVLSNALDEPGNLNIHTILAAVQLSIAGALTVQAATYVEHPVKSILFGAAALFAAVAAYGQVMEHVKTRQEHNKVEEEVGVMVDEIRAILSSESGVE